MNLLFMFIVSVNRGIMYRCCRRLAIVIKTKIGAADNDARAVCRSRQHDIIVFIFHYTAVVILRAGGES